MYTNPHYKKITWSILGTYDKIWNILLFFIIIIIRLLLFFVID